MIQKWKNELRSVAKTDKIKILSSYFKTGKGEYAEGDIFIGVTVPNNRKIAIEYADAPIKIFAEMLHLYLANVERCNNWDLVDLSAPHILGRELAEGRYSQEHNILSCSESLWARRTAVVKSKLK